MARAHPKQQNSPCNRVRVDPIGDCRSPDRQQNSSWQSLKDKDSQTRTGARDISVRMQASEDEQNPEPPALPAIMG